MKKLLACLFLILSTSVIANEEKRMIIIDYDKISVKEDGFYVQTDDGTIKVSAIFHVVDDAYVTWRCEFCDSMQTIDECPECMQMLINSRTYQDYIDKLYHDKPLYNSNCRNKEVG